MEESIKKEEKPCMSLEMRLSEYADNYRNATRNEIRVLIDQIVYKMIDMVVLDRDQRKYYRDIYHKFKAEE